MSFHVASEFFALLIGKKGATKKRIEGETKTRIIIPKQGAEGDVVISAIAESSVRSAWRRIQVIVDNARAKHEFTHFLSLPMNTADMKEAFAQFKNDCLEKFDGRVRGVEASVFQDPGLLHLTIGTMALMDETERKQASALLERCKEDLVSPLLNGEPLQIRVSGLEIMNDDPGEVDVVYAKVEPISGGDSLQQLADGLVERFVSSGLMVRQYDRVKLHLTLMNTLFRSDAKAGICDNEVSRQTRHGNVDSNGRKPRESLDARDILSEFGNRVFVDKLEVREIHLSQRRAGRRTNEGYYWPSGKVEL